MNYTDEQLRSAKATLRSNLSAINDLAAQALAEAMLTAMPEASNDAVVLSLGNKGQEALADLFQRIAEVCNGQRMMLTTAGFDSDTAEMMAANAYTATIAHYVHSAG